MQPWLRGDSPSRSSDSTGSFQKAHWKSPQRGVQSATEGRSWYCHSERRESQILDQLIDNERSRTEHLNLTAEFNSIHHCAWANGAFWYPTLHGGGTTFPYKPLYPFRCYANVWHLGVLSIFNMLLQLCSLVWELKQVSLRLIET